MAIRSVSLPIWRAWNRRHWRFTSGGHVPVIGEWLALPLAAAAGSTQVGDAVSEAFLYPVAHRLIAQCQAVYRIEGASAGADNDVWLANEWGLTVYRRLEEIPPVQG